MNPTELAARPEGGVARSARVVPGPPAADRIRPEAAPLRPRPNGRAWTEERAAIRPPSFVERLCRRMLLRVLASLREGELTLREGGSVHVFGAATTETPIRAELEVLDPAFYPDVVLHGSVGAGRTWFRGQWTSRNLVQVVQVLARNDDALSRWRTGFARMLGPIQTRYHRLRRNTREGSRRNIEAHYDLSNEFFALFLDDTMTYSAGLFTSPETTLREASVAKLDRICRVLELGPTDHVLEIGTGWGSFALHAASRYGCRVTTTTISKEQHALAASRIRAAGLEDRVTVLLRDYRDLEGTYDKVVSVEMIEAVGHEFLDTYFRVCCERLRPGGRMCLQAITIRDDLYDRARTTLDFIKRYVFPGSDIPSLQSISDSVERATDFRITDYFDLTNGYARTLRAWRENLLRRGDDARRMGWSDPALRLWEFYFAYCEGGFRERRIQDYQILLERPGGPA